jgi:MFS family permease
MTLARTAFVTAVASNLGFAVGVIGPSIRNDLGPSHAALGLISSLFFASTGLASIAAGHLVSRAGTRGPAVAALAAACVGCLGAGLLGNYAGLLIAAAVAGAGYSIVNVATNRIVRSISPPGRLGRSMAIKTSGVPLATTAIAITGGLTARWGWRPTIFVLAGFAGLAVVVAATTQRPDPPTGWADGRRRTLPAGFLLLPLAGFCAISGAQPLYSWFAIYLHESLHVATGTATLVSGLCTATGIPAMIIAARLSDRLGTAHRARFLSGLCGIGAVVLLVVLSAHTLGTASAVVAVAVGAAANLSLAGLFPALIVECAPHAIERGTGVAMTGYFLGALASPVGFGALTDTPGGYPLAWTVTIGVSLAGAVLFLGIGRGARATGQPLADAGLDLPMVG